MIEISNTLKWAKKYYLQNFKWWKTLDKDFVWKSFSKKELNEMQKVCLVYVDNVFIRGYDE
jgi:hypothetical protein